MLDIGRSGVRIIIRIRVRIRVRVRVNKGLRKVIIYIYRSKVYMYNNIIRGRKATRYNK